MKLKTILMGSVLLMAAGIFAAENNPLNGIVKVEVRASTPNYLAPWQQSMQPDCYPPAQEPLAG